MVKGKLVKKRSLRQLLMEGKRKTSKKVVFKKKKKVPSMKKKLFV